MPLSRILAAAGLSLVLAGAAHAFTIEGGPGSDGPASRWQDLDTAKPKATDPDSRFKNEDGRTVYKSGNSSFYVGQERSFDQRYNADNLFNPYARDGR